MASKAAKATIQNETPKTRTVPVGTVVELRVKSTGAEPVRLQVRGSDRPLYVDPDGTAHYVADREGFTTVDATASDAAPFEFTITATSTATSTTPDPAAGPTAATTEKE